MAQIKIEKNGHYTVVANAAVQNPSLSLKAKGLLVYMLSLPEDWDYSIQGLARTCQEGVTAIRSAIHELMEAGHVVREQARDENGKLDGYTYTVYETPPSCENPTTEVTTSEDLTQQNKYSTKEIHTNPPISPQGDGAEDKPKKAKGEPYRLDWFNSFWTVYPRKDNKQAALRAWCKIKPDLDTCRRMAIALARDKASRQWNKDDGEFIPMPATWLNQRRWENEGVDASQLAGSGGSSGGWAEDPERTL